MPCLIDTTLREGEQTPGLLFTLEDKKSIVDGLVRLGVGEVEAGISSKYSVCLPELIRWCREEHPRLRVSLWSRCRGEDIREAVHFAPDILALSVPVSDLQVSERLGKSRAWVKEMMVDAITEALSCGLTPAVGFEDATRAERGFLLEMAQAAQKAGAVRLRLADTVGIASPGLMAELVKALLRAVPGMPIGVHTHNDFGMAVGNVIAAFEAGASCADGVLFGLGERSGCASLEQVAGWLSLVAKENYNMEALRELIDQVAACAGRPVPVNQPLVGENIFACESGLHLHGLHKNPAIYEPYNPALVGAERRLQIGSKAGRAAVVARLAGLGYSGEVSEALLRTVRARATLLRRALEDGELLEIAAG